MTFVCFAILAAWCFSSMHLQTVMRLLTSSTRHVLRRLDEHRDGAVRARPLHILPLFSGPPDQKPPTPQSTITGTQRRWQQALPYAANVPQSYHALCFCVLAHYSYRNYVALLPAQFSCIRGWAKADLTTVTRWSQVL